MKRIEYIIAFAVFIILFLILSVWSGPDGIYTNAIDVNITNIHVKPSVNWQYDSVRENNRLYAIEQAQAEQWQATNTNGFVYYAALRRHIPFEFITNTIELGYRSDGVVVWRTPPEK